MRTRDTDTDTATDHRTARRTSRPDPAHASVPAAPAPARRLLALQATTGNAVVVRMLQRAAAGRPAEHRAGGVGAASAAPVQGSAVHDVLRRTGRPLDVSTRAEMEARLGADFSDVRIHDDSAARASAAQIGARAYTSGTHVVLGDDATDRHTLAHELTHVIQQRQGPVAGADNGQGLRVSDPGDRFEREAETNAARALSTAPPRHGGLEHGRTGRAGAVREVNAPEPAQAGFSVQRMPGRSLRSAPPVVPVGKDRDTLLTELQRHAEAWGRWTEEYKGSFAEFKRFVPPTFQASTTDESTSYNELSAAYLQATDRGIEHNAVLAIFNYLLHGGTPAPGLGGLGTLHIEGTELTGRPNFAKSTQDALPVPAGFHRRHITAWHNIRSFLNHAYKAHGTGLTGYLGVKLGHGQVHSGMREEASKSFGKMPTAEFGNIPPAHAEVLLHAAYVMNSSVRNLWVGWGEENSEINAVSQSLQRGLRDATPETLTDWRDRLNSSGAKSVKARTAVINAIGKINTALGRMTADPANEQATFAALKEDILDKEIRSLEVDLPGAASATPQAIGVGNLVYELLFLNPAGAAPTFDQVKTVIDFLWTS